MIHTWFGLHRLSEKDIARLGFPGGALLEVVPSPASLGSMTGMQTILYMLQNYPGRFSFEIWKDRHASFHFFTSSKSSVGMLKSQLLSVYPQSEIRLDKKSMPSVSEGDYAASCSIALFGSELDLRYPGDFHYDPLRHLLEAASGTSAKVFIQVLFGRAGKIPKGKAAALEQKYGDLHTGLRPPVLNSLVRVSCFSPDERTALESMKLVSRVFSVFDSGRARLVPRFPFIPGSLGILKGMNGRAFPLFRKGFLVSVPELACMVHLPCSGIPGVEYSRPPLSEPDFFGD